MNRFLFSARGRLDRLGYLFALLIAGVLLVAPVAMMAPEAAAWGRGAARLDPGRTPWLIAGTVCWLIALPIYCATTARRLHDLGRSGWLTLLALIPAVGLGALTVALLLWPGQPQPNRYGGRWL